MWKVVFPGSLLGKIDPPSSTGMIFQMPTGASPKLYQNIIYDFRIRNFEFPPYPSVLISNNTYLVDGFNPYEKYESNWIISPGRGENKNCLKPPPRYHVFILFLLIVAQ